MLHLNIDDFSPAAIAESGQVFRMVPVENETELDMNAGAGAGVGAGKGHKADSGACDHKGHKHEFGAPDYSPRSWELMSRDKYLRITACPEGGYDFSCSIKDWQEYYINYFDLRTDYSEYRDYCMDSDEFLKNCISFGDGIRILNQDSFEMLISFLISQRKSVPAIRTAIAKLSKLCGDKVETEYGIRYAFPTAEQIAEQSLEAIDTTGTGYRSEYILKAARQVASGQIDMEVLADLPDDELLEALMQIRGVGLKVASCTALFGFHRISLCPQDVWMNRVLSEVYHGTWPEEYKPVLGVLQQYMFNYARLRKGTEF